MRGKKAKALRRQARDLATGMPERKLLAVEYTVKGKAKGLKEAKPYHMYTAVNDPNSFRGIYRNLKRQARHAA